MVPRALLLLVAAVLIAGSCDAGTGERPGPPASPFLTPSRAAGPSPTLPAIPSIPQPTRGTPSPDCVEGWITPEPASRLGREPIGVVRRAVGFDGSLEVVDMRYFVGPESPPTDKGYLREVRRWYLKVFDPDDPAFQGRFLVESRRFGRGVAAVAPYDTIGFRSPDWVGFQWNAADTEAKGYAGLPGTWRGVPYDFVRGGAGLEIPGLPTEVRGCLEGT